MRVALFLVALLIPLLATAAKPDPADVIFYERALQLPSEPHEIPAALLAEPMPWAVGQWTMYRRTDKKGRVSVNKMAIVGQDDCGWWVESMTLDHKQRRSVVKICYSSMPRAADTFESTVDNTADLVQVMITADRGNDPSVLDFRGSQGQMMRAMMGPYANSMIQDWDLSADSTETVTVQAGTFPNAIRVDFDMRVAFIRVRGTGHVHPAVPVNGSVRVETNDGSVEELIDFGLEGATSELPNAWAP